MTTPQLPDFMHLNESAADTGDVNLGETLLPSGPKKTDTLPDFSSIDAAPAKSIRQQNVDKMNQIKTKFYDDMGIRPGALRGFLDTVPSALLSALGTETEDVTAAASGAWQSTKQLGTEFVEHPIDTTGKLAGGMLEGVIKPFVQYPLELIANSTLDLTQLDPGQMTMGAVGMMAQGQTLTPEERERHSKSFTANAIGWILGMKASEAIATRLVGQEAIIGGQGLKDINIALEEAQKAGIIATPRVAGDIVDQAYSSLSIRQLKQLTDAVVAPQYIRSLAGGTVGGAVGGFATGYLEGDTSASRLQAGLAYAMVAMPLGVAIESAGALTALGKPLGDMPDMISFQAGQIAKLRTLSAFGDLTPAELLFNMNNLATTQSLAATMALRDIEYNVVGKDKNGTPMQYGKNASVIPAVANPAEIMRIVAEHQTPENAALAVVHARKDGMNDIMIAPADVPKSEQDFFAKTGYIHGQQVGYGGRDQWIIEGQGVPEGKRQYRMTLRDLVTDERVYDVTPAQISQLSSREPGDLAIHLGRLVTENDIFDPGQGFAAMGKNTVKIKDIASDLPGWRDSMQAGVYENLGKFPEYRDGKIFIDGQELKPGLNKFEVTNAEHPFNVERPKQYPPDLKTGVMIHVGGEKVESIVPGPDGKPVKTEVTVGIPGEITAILDWNEEIGYKGRVRVGSQNFFSYQPAPNRHIATEQLRRERIAMDIRQSFSSLSEGGAKALMNALNFYGRDRQVRGTMTRYTPEMIKTRLIEDFLDHVGATPDGNFTIHPDEVVAYSGFSFDNVTGNPNFQKSDMISQRGESPETLLGRLAAWRLRDIRGEGLPRLFTESKKPLTTAESLDLLREQIKSDAVPTVRTQLDRAIDRTELSFNDITNSFMAAQGVRPEAATAVRNFLENQIGKELLGTGSVRARLADRSAIPILQERVNKFDRAIEKFKSQADHNDGYLPPRDAAKLQEVLGSKEVFEARIRQINEAGPLPFTDQEKQVYSRLVIEAQQQRRVDASDLYQTAVGNGFAVEREEGGAIILRDAETWTKMPQRFADAGQARDFINATGRAKGMDIDGGGNNLVPPSSVAGPAMLPPEPAPRLFEAPHQFAPDTRVSKIMTLLDTVAPWFTPKRAFMVALDNTFKTRFYDQVYLPLQTAKMRLEAIKRPFLEQAKQVEDMLLGDKVDRDRWKTITGYRESMSPDEVVNNLFKDRKLTAAEIDYANRLVDQKIDIQKVFGFRRAADELKRGFDHETRDIQTRMAQTQDPSAQQAFQQQLDQLKQQHEVDMEGARAAFVMDDNHLKAVDMFKEISNKPINEASLYGVSRLARAIQNGETSRAQFAAANKMSGTEIAAAKRLDALYSNVAKFLNIDERITNYFNHFRAYTDMPDATPAKLRQSVLRGAIDDMPAIASEMIRSGEMNVYETDPVKAMVQYINTTFAQQHFNPVWKDARNAAVEHLQQISKGRDAAANVINEYVGGMRGVPAASDQLAQLAFDKFMDAMGIDARPEIRKDIINTFLAATSGAFLGYRPAQGARDFAQFTKIYYSRFGTQRLNNGLGLAFKRDANGVRMLEKLSQEGTIPGLSVLQFASEEELANGIAGGAGRVKDAIFAASELGLKLSGQHNAYSLAHAIAYLDTRELTAKTLLDLSRGEVTKDVAYKTLRMNSYDIPVAEGFDRLVTDGKFNEATEYLAQSTGAETAFIFGLQNHPYGWGTNVGKLAGQFGTWAVWTRNYLTRLAGRGTAGERAAAMARFASAEVATGLAGKALGFNMRSWYMLPGMIFMGGPAFDYAQQIEDMAGIRGRMRQDLATKQLTNGSVPVLSQLMPGAAAFHDYFQAWQLSQKRYGPIAVLGKGLGFSVDQTQRSWMDELMGNQPQTSGR